MSARPAVMAKRVGTGSLEIFRYLFVRIIACDRLSYVANIQARLGKLLYC
jgi:hypothetical protein